MDKFNKLTEAIEKINYIISSPRFNGENLKIVDQSLLEMIVLKLEQDLIEIIKVADKAIKEN